METLEYLIINENGTINIMEHNGEGAEHKSIRDILTSAFAF